MSEDDSYDGNQEGNSDFGVMYEGNEHGKYALNASYMRTQRTTSNAGEADQTELPSLSSSQAGALPSHNNLVRIIVRGLFSMEVIVVATCCRSSSLRCKSFTELLLLLTQPSSSLLLNVPSSIFLLKVPSSIFLLKVPSSSLLLAPPSPSPPPRLLSVLSSSRLVLNFSSSSHLR